MEWAEIKRRLKNGVSVQVLADLEAIPYKTMYNRIMAHQVKDGVTYLTPENTKGMKKAKAISDTKQKQAKEKEKAAGLPEVMPVIVTNDYSCKGCAHCMQTSFNMLCEMGHECGENCVCSDYKAFPEKKKKVPNPGPAASINGVNLCNNCKMCQKDPAPFCKKFRHKLDGIVDYCSGYVSGVPEDVPKLPEVSEDKPLIIPFPDPEKVGLCPEVMEMLRENCEACRKLAESYARQASEYAHLLKRYGVDIPEARKKKDEDLRRVFSEVQ